MDKVMEDLIASLVKQAVYDKAKQMIMSAIIKKLPFFAGKFFNPILGFLVGKLLDVVYEEVWRAIRFAIVDIETTLEQKAYLKAVDQMREVLKKENATDEQIAEAERKFDEALRDLIRFPDIAR